MDFTQWNIKVNRHHHSAAFRLVLTELRIAIFREGFTSKEIADSAGISPQTIDRWMSHETWTPHMRTICDVAYVLGIDELPVR